MRHLTTAFILSAIALSAGCSSKTEDASNAPAASGTITAGSTVPLAAASGSRLKAMYVTAGGARQLVGFHDSMRNEDCTFQDAEAGKMRCLPLVAQSSPSNTFSDAACKVPSATTPTCGEAKYGVAVAYDPSSQCGGTLRALRKLLPATAPIYASGQGGCAAQPAGAPAGQFGVQRALGDIVPWTDFVDAATTTVASNAVSEQVLVASDGARQHFGFHDAALDADCTFQVIADGTTRCVPSVSTGPIVYSDAACQTPMLVEYYNGQSGGQTGVCGTTGQSQGTENLWLEPSATACGGVRNVYKLRDYSGSADAMDPIYRFGIDNEGSGPSTPAMATCISAGNLSPSFNSDSRRSIDSTITSSLPKVERLGGGSDRLVPALVWPAGTANTLTPGFHDTERDVDCTFTTASDGKMRCLPVAASATLYFTDTACKSPNQVAIVNQASCIGTGKFATVTSTTCPPTTTVYALGTTSSGQAGSVTTTPGHCAKVSGATKSAVDATVVDPSQFVEGAPSVE